MTAGLLVSRATLAGVLAAGTLASCGDGDSATNHHAEVSVPATAVPLDEWGAAMVRCLAVKGWDAELMPDGGIQSDVPPDQRERRFEAGEECNAELGWADPPPLSREQLQNLYQAKLDQKDCLDAAGFETGEPPSLESFVESGGGWAPYDEFMETHHDPDELLKMREECPDPEV